MPEYYSVIFIHLQSKMHVGSGRQDISEIVTKTKVHQLTSAIQADGQTDGNTSLH